MNDNNINLLVLRSFFDLNNVWLEDIELLGSDYAMLTRKLLSIEMNNGKLPSLALIMKNVEKLNFNLGEEEIPYKKKVKSILASLVDISVDINNEELLELLRENYLTNEMFEEVPRLTKNLTDKNFEKVRLSLNKLDNILQNGMNKAIEFEDNNSLFLENEETINFKYTGYFDDLPYARVPEGSLCLLIARSKQGKTSLLIQSLINNYLKGENVYLISYEIPKVSIINRALSYIASVPLSEINDNQYSVSDNSVRVKIARYVLARQITFKEALKVYLQEGYEGLEKIPVRENKLIIRASITKGELEKLKSQNKKFNGLPTDIDILKEIKDINKHTKLDWVYIDYLSLIPFVDSKNSREHNISSFSRNLKQTLMETSTCGFVLAQAKSKAEFAEPLYSQGILLDSDLCVSIMGTAEQLAEGMTTIHITLSRHSEGFKSFQAERRLDIQTFTLTGDSMEYDDFYEKYSKSIKDTKKDKNS